MMKQISLDASTGTRVGAYYLERSLGPSKLGPSFLARTNPTTAYLLRFLQGPSFATPQERESYFNYFHYRASQIAALQHPYLLPLVDVGIFHGVPYLVIPHLPLRSLRTRLDKHGPLNTFTVGRYLDQIATALEYAHEHAIVHGRLSVDTIFIRLDGQLMVADVGVSSLLEVTRQKQSKQQVLEWEEGCAPEQLLGKPAQPSTDVYALGAVIYHLLTGSSIFAGSTHGDLAHLSAPLVPPTHWRSDLPISLYSVLARAMTQDPAQRFPQPGALANAYHQTVGLTNRTRLPFVVSATSQLHVLEPLITEPPLADTQFSDDVRSTNQPVAMKHPAGEARSTLQPSTAYAPRDFAKEQQVSRNDSPRPALMRRLRSRHRRQTLLIASLVVLLVIASSVLGGIVLSQKNTPLSQTSGQVIFFTAQPSSTAQTNALQITLTQLVAPPAGEVYTAWILNDQAEEVLGLGKLTATTHGWSLTYSNSNSNLLAVGDKLEVTEEQGGVNAPAGPVILAGSFPSRAFQHVEHLLVSFPAAPGKTALLLGLLQQTRLLDDQARVLQSEAASGNTAMMRCVTQSMLNSIEGLHGLHYQRLTTACIQHAVSTQGDGFGLLGKGYVSSAEKHAALALSQPDATAIMHQHAELMDIALTNITRWLTTLEQALLHLQDHPTDLSPLQEVMTLTNNVYHGVDVNRDGHIDPVAGEAGAQTALQQGQLMATLTLVSAA